MGACRGCFSAVCRDKLCGREHGRAGVGRIDGCRNAIPFS
nr:MAG TPA: hypothetical protein [Caudoviricetes sp.]